MTTADLPAEPQPGPETSSGRFDRFLEDMGEYLNPILVKETRQALKSRQFVVTFTLVLLTSWLWSVFAIYVRYPDILYSPEGPLLLVGYLDILLFPLILIIPFSAFRSLASEREDGTYELLSISTLSPRQIITGKLVSSILQMLVYLSAMAPCIAFTYLLRGIDIITIVFVVMTAVLASILLSAVGLVLACVTRQSQWQSALSVVIIVLLLVLYVSGLTMTYASIYENGSWRMYQSSDFWLSIAATLTIYASYLHLAVEVASSQITFASENRSARIRITLLVQQFLFVGWLGLASLNFPTQDGPLTSLLTIICLHWFIMGCFINGESPALSPRVKRTIPEFVLDRIWRNWLLPGPDRGFLFVTSGLFSGVLCVCALSLLNSLDGKIQYSPFGLIEFSIGLTGFTMLYLGFGRLIVRGLNAMFHVDVFLSMIIHLILLLAGVMFSLICQILYNQLTNRFMQSYWTNPFWFYLEYFERGKFFDEVFTHAMIVAICLTAFLFFFLNLLLGVRQLVPTRELERRFQPELLPKSTELDIDPLV